MAAVMYETVEGSMIQAKKVQYLHHVATIEMVSPFRDKRN